MGVSLPSWLRNREYNVVLQSTQKVEEEADRHDGNENRIMTSCIRVDTLSSQQLQSIQPVIDYLGAESAKAQCIAQPMTSIQSLQHNGRASDRVYLIAQDCPKASGVSETGLHALGFLRVGSKHLFMESNTGFHECDPLCLLDFYLRPEFQREGLGKQLFDSMLQNEKVSAEMLAYDRPTESSIQFLHRQYGLSYPEYKANQFVVFPGFWRHH